MKKQHAAYTLALLFGATSIFGGSTLPLFERDMSVVLADSATTSTVSTEDELQDALEKGGSIILNDDIVIQNEIKHNMWLDIDKDIILDLNGHTLSDTNNSAAYFAITSTGNMTVKGSGTIVACIQVENADLKIVDGTITGWVQVSDGDTTVLDGEIDWNLELDGTSSKCQIQGGLINSISIDGCDVTMAGGLVRTIDLSGGNLYMSGGVIDGDDDTNDSHGIYIHNGIFTMSGGTIANNSFSGVLFCSECHGKFIMTGGNIINNGNKGVDLANKYDIFDMSGGTISKNAGGGVDVGDGTFTMTGGSINNNGDTGVYANSEAGTFTLSGGSITNNHSRNPDRTTGGGVYIYDTTFNISGSPVISGNKNDDNETENVYLSGTNAKINITGALKDGCNIGVYPSKTGDFTKNYATHNGTTDPTKYFSSDQSNYSVSRNAATGEAQLVKTSSSSSSSSSSNTTARNTATSRSTSSSSSSARSSSSSSSDDDDSSSSKSFSDGGTKTGGSGASKGDYKKAGKTGAKYTMAEISDKATAAKVPATVKIGKKTYNVTAISSDAFIGYSNLKTVTIGKNIKKIGKSAFSGCSSLKTLTIHSKKLTAKNIQGALKGSAVKTVYVPANMVQAYKKIFTKKNTSSKSKITVKAIKS